MLSLARDTLSMFVNPWFTLHKYLLRGYSRFPVISSLSMDDSSLHLCIVSLSSFKYLSMEILSKWHLLLAQGGYSFLSMLHRAPGPMMYLNLLLATWMVSPLAPLAGLSFAHSTLDLEFLMQRPVPARKEA